MDTPPPPANPPEKKIEEPDRSSDYALYPKIDPKDLEYPPPPLIPSQSTDASRSTSNPATTMPVESNPYVTPAPTTSTAPKFSVDAMRDAIGKLGKSVGDAAKSTEELAGNFWQHLKTGPSFADAAMGVITEGTKVIAEGGYEKIFQKTFETLTEEQLKKSYTCFLSTSAGPVRGVLFLSTVKLAFSSDNPLSYKVGDKTEWSYYKVVIPLNQLRTVNPSTSKVNPAEKYIQVVSVDDHEFWFMGFVNYESAVKNLQEAGLVRDLQQ